MSEKKRTLFKTTIVIWSEYDPNERGMEIDVLADQAMDGDAFCESEKTERVTNTKLFPDTEFFDGDEEDGDEGDDES